MGRCLAGLVFCSFLPSCFCVQDLCTASTRISGSAVCSHVRFFLIDSRFNPGAARFFFCQRKKYTLLGARPGTRHRQSSWIRPASSIGTPAHGLYNSKTAAGGEDPHGSLNRRGNLGGRPAVTVWVRPPAPMTMGAVAVLTTDARGRVPRPGQWPSCMHRQSVVAIIRSITTVVPII
jgi:hypothetical protein